MSKLFDPEIYMIFLPNSFIIIGSVTLLFFFAVSLFTKLDHALLILGAIMSAMILGTGLYLRTVDPGTMLGPIVSQPKFQSG